MTSIIELKNEGTKILEQLNNGEMDCLRAVLEFKKLLDKAIENLEEISA